MENGSSFLVTFAHEARATYCWCFQNSDVKPVEIGRKSTQYLQLLVQFHAFLVVSQSSQASTVLKTCSWSQIESCRTEIWGWNVTDTTVLSFKQSAAWKFNTDICIYIYIFNMLLLMEERVAAVMVLQQEKIYIKHLEQLGWWFFHPASKRAGRGLGPFMIRAYSPLVCRPVVSKSL